jgi:hypothetical protein
MGRSSRLPSVNRMKLLAPLCVLLVLLVLGCAPAPAPGSAPPSPSSVAPGTAFALPLGQSRTVAGLVVRFDSVLSDSRCKPGVRCVWEGDAVVAVALDGGEDGHKVAELHSNAQFPHTADHSGHRVALVSVNEPADEVTLRVLPAA